MVDKAADKHGEVVVCKIGMMRSACFDMKCFISRDVYVHVLI